MVRSRLSCHIVHLKMSRLSVNENRLLYGELVTGKRSAGKQKMRFKNSLLMLLNQT